jgi:hypothetical protein
MPNARTYFSASFSVAELASCSLGEGELMPGRSPYRIELSDEERSGLESLARSYTSPYWQVTRSQMVLMAADGLRNDQIAARLRCGREVVSQWRKRFFEQRRDGLEDGPWRGRPPVFPPSGSRRSTASKANTRT